MKLEVIYRLVIVALNPINQQEVFLLVDENNQLPMGYDLDLMALLGKYVDVDFYWVNLQLLGINRAVESQCLYIDYYAGLTLDTPLNRGGWIPLHECSDNVIQLVKKASMLVG